MSDPDSLRRLEHAVLHVYGADTLTADIIARLLGDIRHLCDRQALSHGLLDQVAHERYLRDIGMDWTVEDILRREG